MSILSRAIARIKNGLQLDGRTETVDTTEVEVILKDSRGVLLAYGATVPTDNETGYAKGCIFIDTNATAGAVMLANEGDDTACDFNTSLVSGDISSVTAGAGLTGGGASGAVTLDVAVDNSSIEIDTDTLRVKALGIVAAMIASGAVDATKLNAAEARTATADGLTTGVISTTTRHTTVTSDDASKIVTLPASVVGKEITGFVGATGFRLQTTASSNIKINNVDCDGTNYFAVAANTFFFAKCVSATEWLVYTLSNVGALPTANIADGAITAAKVRAAQTITATDDGLTTGAIAEPTSLITVATITSAGATKAVTLPAASAAGVGNVIYLVVGANGYELLTPASGNDTINQVDSDGTNQLDVAADTTVRCTQITATGWLAETIAATTIAVTAPDND